MRNNIIEKILDNDDQDNHITSQQQRNDTTVQMIIQLDSLTSVALLIRQNDDPLTLAKKFCYQHNIDPRVIGSLANNIRTVKFSSSISDQFEQQQNSFTTNNNNTHQNSLTQSVQRKNKTNKRINTSNINNDNSLITQSSQNVFDRLYRDSRVKQTTIRQTNSSYIAKSKEKSIQKNSLNCSQLYTKNVKIKQQINRRNQYLLQQKIQKQQSECTYQPRINPLSSLIAQKLRQTDYKNMSLSNYKKTSKLLEYLKDKQQKQMKECTFEPKIVSKSHNKSISTTTERYIHLHQDYNLQQTKKKIIRQKLYQNKLTFHPSINQISANIVKNKNFFDRLQQYEKIKKQKKSKQNKQQQSRKPSTGRQPAHRNKGSMSIGQYLYNNGLKSKAEKQKKHKVVHKVFTSQKSQLIYQERKKIAFRYLFTLMDSDEDGLISATKINIQGLNDQILKLMSPLLSQMEEIKAQLDQQQFVQSFSRLFQTFSIHQKNSILCVYKHPTSQPEQLSFHPQINEKSVQMAKQIRTPGASLYQLWKQNYMERQAKMNELRNLRNLQEYEECTFQPNIFHLD